MTRRQHSLRKTFVKEPSVLTHDANGGKFGISAREIMQMNEDGLADTNMRALASIQGPQRLAALLDTDISSGISAEDDLEFRAKEFGRNWMPVPNPKTWIQLFIDSFDDTTLIILIVSAIVSLAVGFYSDPAKGWIEGVAILCAVLVVAVVTATNDYSKDKQFRALNAVKEDVTAQASVIHACLVYVKHGDDFCHLPSVCLRGVGPRGIGGASDEESGREAGVIVSSVCKRVWKEKTRLGQSRTRG